MHAPRKMLHDKKRTAASSNVNLDSDTELRKRMDIRSSDKGISLNQRMKRELDTAGTTRTDLTRTTDKTIPSFHMHKASVKYTIFETNPGANERRFEPFVDMPHCNSKYNREQIGIMDFTKIEGRERIDRFNPEPLEMQPDYQPNVEYFAKSLSKGAVRFGSMSCRTPNVNKTYGKANTFYT